MLSWKKLSVTVLLTVLMGLSGFAALGGAAAAGAGVHVVPAAGSLGVVTIEPNGTVNNPLAPIAVNGSTYTFTASMSGALDSFASNITINGAGYAVNYSLGPTGNGIGITIDRSSNVLVEDFHVTNATVGIFLNNTTSVVVLGNDLSGLNTGIKLVYSVATTVTQNLVDQATAYGVDGNVVRSLTISNNSLIGDGRPVGGYAVYLDHAAYATISGNDANGTYYGMEFGYSHDIRATGNNLSFSADGVGAYYAQNVEIDHNQAFQSTYGIWSEYSSNVTVLDNYEPYGSEPLWDYEDVGFVAQGNYAPHASSYGIYTYYSVNSAFANNNLANSDYGAYVEYSTSVTIQANDLSNATAYGVYDYSSYENVAVVGNNLSEPGANAAYGFYGEYTYGSVRIVGNAMQNLYSGVYQYEPYGSTQISGDTITNTSVAVSADYSYGPIIVSDCNLSASGYGVEDSYQYGGSLTVTNNTIENTAYGVYFDEDTYGPAPLTVTNNVITNASSYAVYEYYSESSTVITGNDLANAQQYGVYSYYNDYASTLISNNNVSNAGYEGIYVYSGFNVTVAGNDVRNSSSYGIDLEYDYGLDTIIGNDLRSSQNVGIYDYSESQGAVTISGNNASGSYEGLYLYNAYVSATITGNDFASNAEVYFDSNVLATVAGNNFLNDSSMQVVSNTIGLFYHNDINSSAFLPSSNTVEGTWNAAYPIGGNYWTGYSGVDLYSGPNQNLPGSDGIGDTPYTLLGQTDLYPLMHPWTSSSTTFTETGLPAGATWSVTFNGVTQSSAAGGSIVFVQTNGAYTPYNYTVGGPSGYVPTPARGSGTMQGTSQSVAVVFAPFRYTVTASETGLAAGTAWGIDVAGTWTNGTTASLSIALANGTYSYSFASVTGYSVSPASGTLTVNGSTASVTANYTQILYTVTFTVSGLPSGASWSVTLNGQTLTSTSNTIRFSVASPGGTLTYTVTGPSGYTLTPSAGSVDVSSSSPMVSIFLVGTSSSTSSSSGTVSSGLFYGTLGGLIVLLLVAAALAFLLFGRRRKSSPPGGGAPPGAATGVKPWEEGQSGTSEGAAGAGTPPSPPASGGP